MRIYMEENGRQKINVHLPSGLVLNTVTATLAAAFVKGQDGERYTGEQLRRAVQAVNEYRKSHPEWVLMEVQTHTGQQVEIRL